uniref:Uncharacterized protein n=1 Tax=Romanomermis culicivorax TaxID=13658 RepID=A0A915HXP4_ROMCU
MINIKWGKCALIVVEALLIDDKENELLALAVERFCDRNGAVRPTKVSFWCKSQGKFRAAMIFSYLCMGDVRSGRRFGGL